MAKSKDHSKKKAPFRIRLLRIAGVFLLSLLLLSAGAWFYVQNQKDKVVAFVLEYLNEEYSGDITYDGVSLERWTGFSAPSIYFENLTVVDTSGTSHLHLQASKLGLEVSIKNLLRGLIQIKQVSITDGALMLDNYTPLTPEEEMGLPPVLDSAEMSARFTNTLLEKSTRLEISDLDIEIRHHVKNKLFKFQVDQITSEVEFTDETIRSRTHMDVFIDTLGFNLAKGSFVNGAQALGDLDLEFDLPRRELRIEAFPLEVGDQAIETTATLNFTGVGSFDIGLVNRDTGFDSARALLTENIRQKFSAIELEEGLYTSTKLKGRFVYKDNPWVEVQFKTDQNTAVFEGGKRITDLTFAGRFLNRVHPDETREKEDVKNFRIELPQLKGRYRDIALDIADLKLLSSPEAENAFSAKISAGGSPESLNDFVEDQHWSFKGGQFEMTSEIEGEGIDMGIIIAASRSHFFLEDTRIINNENGIGLPVTDITLSMADNTATLDELRIAVTPGDDLILRAAFRNFSSLFEEEPQAKLHSDFSIESDNLVWDDFIRLLDIANPGRATEKPEVVLQDLLRDIQRKYDPDIDIALGRFALGPFLLTDVVSGMHFDSEDLLILDNTTFGLPGGRMEMEGSLDLGSEDRIPLDASLEGRADIAVLDLILDTEDLKLEGGQFQINASLSGDLLRPNGILRNSSSALIMKDIRATYVPGQIVFPVAVLALELKKDHAELKALTLHVGENDDVTFSGDIQNLSSLLFEGFNESVSSELHITSEKMVWEDYLRMFAADQPKKSMSASKDPQEMIAAERRFKASLRDLYTTLNPRITADIREFRHKDLQAFHDLTTAISFKDGQTLRLEETRFLHNLKTAVNLHAEIDISDASKTHMDIELEASGKPEELNDVLNNDTFFFQGGTFMVSARLLGEIEALDSLIAHSDSELNIRNTFVIHKPSMVDIPITTLDVALQNNHASLRALEIPLESGDQLVLQGEVGYVSDLIFDLPPEESRTYATVTLDAGRVDFDEIKTLFEIGGEGPTEKPETAIKPTIRDIYNKYRPSLEVSIDAFVLDNLQIRNLKTGFHFEGQDMLYLEESSFDFHEGGVRLDAHLDISQPEKTIFSFGFDTDRIDLEKLLQAFDYFHLPSLKSATRIGGLITLDSEIEGEVDQDGEMIPESLKGTINFDLEEAQVAGFEPLMESGSKIFKKERVEDIRFMPIQNTLTLADMRLDIPLMEIQSSAFDLFVAGHLGFGESPTSIWVGFPLDNLKTRDVRNVPDKKGYIAAGKKVYVEARSDEKKGMKYILHLTPKKYYQEREMMEEYRREIREERLQIRRYKRTGELEE